VAVDEQFRRQGVATQLLNHVEGLARRRGISTLKCITSDTANAPALSCFGRYGFHREGFVGAYPGGQRAVGLRRDLDP
jgi:ribosomal protein S18 acetylase RimI-like enzyme